MSTWLNQQGFLLPLFYFPAVSPRLSLSLTLSLSFAQLLLCNALQICMPMDVTVLLVSYFSKM